MTSTKEFGAAGKPSPERWKKTLLPLSSSLGDAVRCLNESKQQIAVVVTEDYELIGTVTDGDIRRGLLAGMTMESAIESIIGRDPLVAPANLDRETALRIMQANKVHQLPVVDDRRRVTGLHHLDDLIVPGRRPNLMVIMAGGQGSRLRPHTENCPKPLLPVGGKPMLEHIIERAKSDGIVNFVLTLHYLGHMIEEYFGDGSAMDVNIRYSHEDKPLGTAGAVGLLTPRPDGPFIVCNGDVLTDIRYGELLDFHARHDGIATMAVRSHEWQNPFGVVKTQGVDIVGFVEKPVTRSHINAGIYVLDPAAVEYIQVDHHCDMPTLFHNVRNGGGRTIVYPMHEPWLDVGRERDLQEAQAIAAATDQSDD